ncbi:MAG: diacylglycerol kinase family lipid kinase [Chloroflexota bacterium]
MDASHEVTLIVNPVAGRGSGGDTADRVAAQLGANNVPHTVNFTRGPGHATVLTRKALREGARTVVSIGGDGTANEIVNGFFEEGELVNPRSRIAFIAAGTGNDVGREFQGHETALQGEKTEYVDLLLIHHTAAAAGGEKRYALFHAGAGLVTEVVETSNRLKARLGKFVYTGASAVALYRHHPSRIRFACDGEPALTQNMGLIIVANGKYAGGGMLIAPPASMQDGFLDVITLQGASRLEMLFRLLPSVYRGSHMGHPAVGHVQARTVLVESDEPLAIEIDGELAGTTPVTIDVCPKALPVCLH